MAFATAFKSLALWKGATRRTSGLEARYETRPMKHAICSSSASAPADPPAPLPPRRRWSRPVEVEVTEYERLGLNVLLYTYSVYLTKLTSSTYTHCRENYRAE